MGRFCTVVHRTAGHVGYDVLYFVGDPCKFLFLFVKGTPEQDRRSKPIRAGKRTVTISAPSSNLLNWQFFASTMEASRKLNIPSGNISNVCNGKQSIAGGYYFKWAPAQVPEVLPGEEWKIIDWL